MPSFHTKVPKGRLKKYKLLLQSAVLIYKPYGTNYKHLGIDAYYITFFRGETGQWYASIQSDIPDADSIPLPDNFIKFHTLDAYYRLAPEGTNEDSERMS